MPNESMRQLHRQDRITRVRQALQAAGRHGLSWTQIYNISGYSSRADASRLIHELLDAGYAMTKPATSAATQRGLSRYIAPGFESLP